MKLVRAWSALVATALGCGTPAVAPGPRVTSDGLPRATTVRAVVPLGFGADAREAGQALILGADPGGGAIVVPLVGAARSVTVDVLVGDGATAAMIAVELTTAPAAGPATGPAFGLATGPATDDAVRVGALDEQAAPSWRAGAWTAAFVTASALGKDVADLRFTADARGRATGATGSALLAAAYLASLLGATIEPRATVLGPVELDGTVGPVADVARALDAALAAGARRIGYPAGLRRATDPATGEPLDLEARARAAGGEAVAIADVHGALEVLTGARLPRPLAVDEAALALEPEVSAALAARYDGWHQRLAAEWTVLLELQASGRLAPPLAALAARAEREARQAERAHEDGLAAAAYHHVVQAWRDAASATSATAILDHARKGDLAAARARLDELAARALIADDALRAIGAVVPDTVADHLRLLASLEQGLTGWASRASAAELVTAAQGALAGLEAAPRPVPRARVDELAARVTPAVQALTRAAAAGTTASEALALTGEPSPAYVGSPLALRRVAASLAAAAGALAAEVEARSARAPTGPLDDARGRLARALPDDVVASLAARLDESVGLPAELRAAWGDGSRAWALLRLAAAEASLLHASRVLRRASLGGVTDEAGAPLPLAQEPALAALLAAAERRAREHARTAQVATGSVPLAARLRYQVARALAAGDAADQRDALDLFGASSLSSQTAVMLARAAAPAAAP